MEISVACEIVLFASIVCGVQYCRNVHAPMYV